MAVASSLSSTFSLLPLLQSSTSAPPNRSFLSFSVSAVAIRSLSIRLSRRRLVAARAEDDVDAFEGDISDIDEPSSELDDTVDEFAEETGFEEEEEEDSEADAGEDESESEVSMEIHDEPNIAVEKTPKKSASKAKGKSQMMPGNMKIRIRLKSYWVPLIEDTCKQILEVARTTNSKTMGPIPLPTKKRIYCVLKSPHKHKDAREHFEIRTHIRLIEILQPTLETVESLSQLDFPAGVDVKLKV